MATPAATTIEDAPETANSPAATMISSWMQGLPDITKDTEAQEPPKTPAIVDPKKPDAAAPVAPKVEAAKAAEVATEPTTEEKWPRTAKDWDAFKSARKQKEEVLTKEKETLATELANVRKEIETLRKQGPSPELDSLRKERDELDDRLKLVAVENHPKFKAYFENKTNAQIELAKRIVGPEKSDRVVEILKMTDSPYKNERMNELVLELNQMEVSRIGGVVNELAKLGQERESEIANARQSYETMQKQQVEQSRALTDRQRQELAKGFDALVGQAREIKHSANVFQPREGDADWNKGVEERIAQAREIAFGANTKPEDLMRASLAYAALPKLMELGQAQEAELTSLREQVKKLSAAGPALKNGEVRPTETRVPVKPGTNPNTALASWMGDLKAAMEQ